MKDLGEEIPTEACPVDKIVEPDEMGWAHGENERLEITKDRNTDVAKNEDET